MGEKQSNERSGAGRTAILLNLTKTVNFFNLYYSVTSSRPSSVKNKTLKQQ